ncbi:DUF167 domain-containing protein [Rhodococcus sp. NPDC058514]|uniref:DUF167 domain-containing protein n=1 Tax=unclassified Rhodococcus (in: high G+C Gram-positive bacteria) TaxID=192944 RepID=UPI00364C483F
MSGSRIVAAQIKPNSKKGPLVEILEDGTVLLYVRAPAVEGRANKAAEELLAEHLGVSKSAVRLVSGQTSRHKRFEVQD